jgi:hypothetical protein
MSAEERNRYRARGWAIALFGAVVLWALIFATIWTASTAFAGSGSQMPYTVTKEGVTLPAGTTFPDSGHVNWRTDRGSYGIHFESANGQPSGVYIGQSFLPFDLADGECVVWVQVSLYDEHYGEGGQQPICNETETPSSTPSPVATEPVPTTSEPVPSPTPSVTSTPTSTPASSQPPPPSAPTSADTEQATSRTFASQPAPDRLADTGRTVTKLDLTLVMFAALVIGLGVIALVRRSNP